MPAATSIIMGASAALSAEQAISGAVKANQANQAASTAANRMARTSETDFSRGMEIPTLGLNLAQQNIARQQADLTRAAREQGPAGVLGAVPSIAQQGIDANSQLAAEADRMQKERNMAQAQIQQGIEGRRVGREYELAGMELQGAQTATAQQRANINAGVQGILEAGAGAAKMDAYNKYLGSDLEKQRFLNSLMGNTAFNPNALGVSNNLGSFGVDPFAPVYQG